MAEPDGHRTRLVLVRHGETRWNAEGRWQGQTGVGLSELGRRQAEATARHLARAFPDAALIARSDAERVVETAAPLEVLLDVPVVVDERLREVDVGIWSGRTSEEVQLVDPEGWAAYRAKLPRPVGGGESVVAVTERMLAAVDDVAMKVGEGTAIVVTHGWALRLAVAGLLQLSAADADAIGRASNCSVTIVDLGEGGAVLDVFGDCAHLEAFDADDGRRRGSGA